MKKLIALFCLLSMVSISVFSQVSKGDVQIIQNYFGTQKAALVKEYMGFTAQQDSAFWPIYNKYENERMEMGKDRIALIDDYLKNVQNITADKANELVNKSNAMEISFKKLLKKTYSELSKKIGPVKAAQFYQFENYLNNIINLSIVEQIPFIGDMEQKHDKMPKKK